MLMPNNSVAEKLFKGQNGLVMFRQGLGYVPDHVYPNTRQKRARGTKVHHIPAATE